MYILSEGQYPQQDLIIHENKDNQYNLFLGILRNYYSY